MDNSSSNPPKSAYGSRTDQSAQTPKDPALTSSATQGNSRSRFFPLSRRFPQSCASEAKRFDFCGDRDLPPPPPPRC